MEKWGILFVPGEVGKEAGSLVSLSEFLSLSWLNDQFCLVIAPQITVAHHFFLIYVAQCPLFTSVCFFSAMYALHSSA